MWRKTKQVLTTSTTHNWGKRRKRRGRGQEDLGEHLKAERGKRATFIVVSLKKRGRGHMETFDFLGGRVGGS